MVPLWPVRDLDDEVEDVRKLIRPYAEHMRPIADRAERASEFPREVVRDLASMGVLGLGFPEEYGGSGGSSLGLCVAIEEIYRVSPGIAASAFMSTLVAHDILQAGDEGQRRELIPPILEGRWMAALAVTEPEAGSDVASLRTTAHAQSGGWRIRGRKQFITNAGIADLLVVLGRTPDHNDRSISAFTLRLPTHGVNIEPPLEKLGWRASTTNGIVFDDVAVGPESLLGELGTGFHLVVNGFNLERATLAAGAVGLAQGALDLARDYAKDRWQFGTPLTGFQTVRHTLAKSAATLEAARQLTYQAARMVSLGEDGAAIASMAKLVAAETCQDIARSCVQIHGGAGFTTEFPIERYFRDSMIMSIGGGTSEIQAEIISRRLGLGHQPKESSK